MRSVMRGLLTLAGLVALVLAFLPGTAAAAPGPTAMTAPHTASSSSTAPKAATPAAAHTCAQTPAPGMATCFAMRRTDAGVRHALVTPDVTPSGFGPADLASAYKLNTAGGTGQTVAIVDAMDDPNAESDLATYRSQFGLPACTTANGCFRKVNQNGATSPLPATDTGWAGEISLDVDMVSAICPNCHILLVEASSPTIANLGKSVNEAVALGAKYVSNSYGGPEDGTEPTDDTNFYRHAGVAVTASTGDSGFGIGYPASSPFVTAVGGTSLRTSATTRGWTETAWSGAGSGCSADEAKPSFQSAVNTGCARRANADVAAVADPATGVAVFQTFGATGWQVYGGTSVSSPIIASVYALAGTPGATDTPAAYPYSHTGNLFDVTSGSNGACTTTVQCRAGVGWDGPTGLGTPNGTAAFTAAGGTQPPPPTGGCTSSGQLLGNAGFESGNTVWSATPAVIAQHGAEGEPAHTGTWDAWLDGYGTTHTDTLSQTVTIPSGCTATLSFFLHIDTSETTTTTQFDRLTVRLGSTTLGTFSNLNHNTGYLQRTFDVSALAGQTVTLQFTGTEDTSLQTSFVVDDTALTVS